MTHRGRVWTTSIAAAALAALPLVASAQTYPTTGSGQSTSGQSTSSQTSSSAQNTPQFHLDEAKRALDAISTADLTGAAMSRVSSIKTQFNELYNNYTNKSGMSSSSSSSTASGSSSTSSATGEQVGTSGTTPPSSASSSSTDWKTQFSRIESDLDSLNIPKSSYAPASSGTTGGMSGTTGATGGTSGTSGSTSGTSGSGTMGSTASTGSVNLPSETREHLVEFRTHLEQFYSLAQSSQR